MSLKKLLLTKLLLLLLAVLPSSSFAVTEFVSTIKSGGDYTTVSTWEAAMDDAGDITAADCKVMAGSLTRGAIGDAVAVTQTTSLATGICIHHTATQILIDTIVGTPNSSGTWFPTADTNDATNAWTPTDAGDSVILVGELNGAIADTGMNFDGLTTSATNYAKITSNSSNRHNGTAASGTSWILYYRMADYYRVGFIKFKFEFYPSCSSKYNNQE
jgi:hypothetical protein